MKQQHEFIDAELAADIQTAAEPYKLTPEWIYKKVKKNKILKRGYQIPSNETFRHLSLFLLDEHHYFDLQKSKVFIDIQNNKTSFLNAIETAISCAEYFKVFTENRINRIRNFEVNNEDGNFEHLLRSSLIPNLKMWNNFLKSAASIANSSDLFTSQKEEKALTPVHWHSFAVAAAEMFRSAVSESNPGRVPLANSYTGPVGQFMALIIPHVTGETPRAETVAKHLQEMSRRNLSD